MVQKRSVQLDYNLHETENCGTNDEIYVGYLWVMMMTTTISSGHWPLGECMCYFYARFVCNIK